MSGADLARSRSAGSGPGRKSTPSGGGHPTRGPRPRDITFLDSDTGRPRSRCHSPFTSRRVTRAQSAPPRQHAIPVRRRQLDGEINEGTRLTRQEPAGLPFLLRESGGGTLPLHSPQRSLALGPLCRRAPSPPVAERASRQRAGMLALVDHHPAVHDHVRNPQRELLGLPRCRRGLHGGGVEDDDVGLHAVPE
jgi:hypothetical protein